MKKNLLLLSALAALGSTTMPADDKPLYMDPAQPVDKRVDDLLARMTLEEKLSQIHANSKFTTPAIPRLGIPLRWLSDGPHGVREDIGPDTWKPQNRTDDFATAMPAGIALASSWNPEVAYQVGEAIGQEARARGKDIMLGPGVNILRTPLCGRNFEYMGEDPYLAGRMAVAYIKGEQAQNVASCIKHFAANNEEFQRMSINVEMDERPLREIYLPAFEAAVKEGGVWTVMGAYNKFRGQFASHNDYLLNKILKGEWNFQGLVMSDWAATHDTKEAALNGLDLEMGTDKPYNEFFLADAYRDGLKDGTYPMSGLDDKVRRNLRVMFATGVFDQRPPGSLNTPAHQAVARRAAEEGTVLLKNDKGILPLDPEKVKSIAIIGENGIRLHAHGGDSSGIKAFYEVSPVEGILRKAGTKINVTYSAGYGKEIGPDAIDRAVEAAKNADVAIIMGGLNHDPGFDCEGHDRKDMKLPYQQDELIRRVVEANPKTIVVLFGTIVEMEEWIAKVPAVLQTWFPGMEGGNALANILFGDVNPSGKIPCTFPKVLGDSPAHKLGAYPGKDGTVTYDEGLLVGYRWFDTKKVDPQFPFGHGLSYTAFKYSDLKLVEGKGGDGPVVTAEFVVENTGKRDGAEVAQLYIQQAKPSLERPLQELKGFKKVFLKAGEKQTVSIPLDLAAFSYFDPAKGGWIAEEGAFTIRVGASSRDIALNAPYKLAKTTVVKR